MSEAIVLHTPIGRIAEHRRVPFKVKFFYGLGDLTSGFMVGGAGYVIFFYNQVMGLPALWVSVAMFAGLYLDAIVDALAGGLSDATKTRWGRRHPYIFLSAIPIAIFYYLAFSVPAGLAPWMLMAWMAVMTAMWRVAQSFFTVPYWALGAELSQDYHERTVVAAFRIFFTFAGSSAVFILNMIIFGGADDPKRGQFQAAPYQTIAIISAVVMILGAWACAFGTRSAIPTLPKAVARFSFFGMLREIRGFWGNRTFRIFFASCFMFCVILAGYQVASIYFGTYFWALTTRQIFLMPAIGIAGMAVGTFVWPAISRRIGKKRSYMIGTAGFAIGIALPIYLKLAGLFVDHDSPFYFPLLTFIGFIAYLLGSAGGVAGASMIPDVIDDYAAGRPDKTVAGLMTSMSMLNTKIGLAATNLLMGGILAFVGLEHKTEGVVDPAVADRLGMTYAPVILVLGALCVGIMSRYPIPDRKWRPAPKAE